MQVTRTILCIVALPMLFGMSERALSQPLANNAAYADTQLYMSPFEVLITAPRMAIPLKDNPAATFVAGEEVLSTVPRGISIEEPLKLVPGLKIDNQANGSRVHMSIRGQGILTERGIRGIKVLLDDIPLNDPTGFAPDFFDVDLSAIGRIEVSRGPSASLYGASASGGIVNIISQNVDGNGTGAEVDQAAGSNGYWKTFGRLGGNYDQLNAHLSASRAMGDGYRQHTHFWNNNVYGKATYTPTSSLSLTPIAEWSHVYHENPEGINLAQFRADPTQPNPDAIPYNEYLETERATGGLSGVLVSGQHELHFTGYAKRTIFTEANNRTFNHRNLMTPGASLQYNYKSDAMDGELKNTVSVGTDLGWQTIDEHRQQNIHSVEQNTILSQEQIKQQGSGFFALDRIDFRQSWGLLLSIRYDQIHNELNDLLRTPIDVSGKADFSKATGRIGITHSLSQEHMLYASWGQGFLPPATEELAQNPDHFGGFNTHLTYATSNGYELGARGSMTNQFYYDLSGFYLSTENDFDRYRITDTLRNQETFYRNAGSSSRFGLEFYSRFVPVQTFEIQAAYTYSHFQYTNSVPLQVIMDDPTVIKYVVDGNFLPNSPMHQLYIDLQYRAAPGLTIGASVETLSKTYIDGSNIESEAADGYTLFHARAAYTLHLGQFSGDLSFAVRNIANTMYVAFTEPDPGGNSYQPGAGREFFSGFKLHL